MNFEDFNSKIDEFNYDDTYSIVIDGKTLSYYDNLSKEIKEKFVYILLNTKTAVCCRLTPKQKSQLSKLLKNKDKIILSIGDGANDVPMIMESSIGVGIFGKEGTQVSIYNIGC